MADREIRLGGEASCFSASVTVEGIDLQPDEISRLLGCTPDSSHRKGDARKRGVPFSAGLWAIESKGNPGDQAGQLATRVMERLPRDRNVWIDISSRFSVTLAIGVFVTGGNRDVVLSKDVIKDAALLGASVWIDMYCSEDDHEGSADGV